MANKKRPAAGRSPSGRPGGSGRPRPPQAPKGAGAARPSTPKPPPSPADDSDPVATATEAGRADAESTEARATAPEAKAAPARQPAKQAVVPAKGPTAEAAAKRQEARAAARSKREEALRRKKAAERKRRLRNMGILGIAVVVIAAAVTYGVFHSRANKHAFTTLSAAAGCTGVQDTDPGLKTLSHAHLGVTQTVTYSTSPPTGGAHNPEPLTSGVYGALSTDPGTNPNIYQAVHSLEHGYVIAWYKNSSDLPALNTLAAANTFKFIVTAYPTLPTGTVGLTAWGRLQYCDKLNTDQIQHFIDQYRLKSASEPNAA